MPDDYPTEFFDSPKTWERWLAQHHESTSGVWCKIAKKASGIKTVAYPEVLDIAISYGWIDGQRRALDESHFLQKFTPRGARSRWSKINRDKATRMIESGAMKPAGLREVELAKADGRWDAAYDSHRTATVPDDLQQALDRNPAALEFFATLNSQNRYAVLYRVQDAKRPETRARRIAQFVEMLARGEKLYP
ncbi:MAG TPA: YdeI/OmpD-associated family protein [Thermoleophilaceae bacterium]